MLVTLVKVGTMTTPRTKQPVRMEASMNHLRACTIGQTKVYGELSGTEKWSANMHLIRKTLGFFVLCFLIAGCATNPAQSPRDYLAYAHSAINRQDWEAAYRLMEDALVSNDNSLRNEANELVRKYPEIPVAARKSFDVEHLEKTYSLHGERAFEIETDRLSVYQHSIATPQEYAQAVEHFHTAYDSLIRAAQEQKQLRWAELRAAQEKEILENAIQRKQDPVYALEEFGAVAELPSSIKGNTVEMLESLKVGHTLRKDVLAKFGRPSRHFELATILTWFIRVDGDTYTVVPTQHGTGVTHSLVLVFSREGALLEKSFVKIVR